MKFTAQLNYLRIAPRKVRLVADLIRRKKVEDAQAILNYAIKKGSLPLSKLLKSAIANAKNNFQIDADNLYISKIIVDEGPKFKRWMPRARGSASEILKRTSNITLVLEEIKPSAKLKKRKAKKTEPVVETEAKDIPGFKKPKPMFEAPKPKIADSINRIFRRKSI